MMSRMKFDGPAGGLPAGSPLDVDGFISDFSFPNGLLRYVRAQATRPSTSSVAKQRRRCSCGRTPPHEWARTSGRLLIPRLSAAPAQERDFPARIVSRTPSWLGFPHLERLLESALRHGGIALLRRDEFVAVSYGAPVRFTKKKSATVRTSRSSLMRSRMRGVICDIFAVVDGVAFARLDHAGAVRFESSSGAIVRMVSAFSQTALGSNGSSSVKFTTALLRLIPSSENASIRSWRLICSQVVFG